MPTHIATLPSHLFRPFLNYNAALGYQSRKEFTCCNFMWRARGDRWLRKLKSVSSQNNVLGSVERSWSGLILCCTAWLCFPVPDKGLLTAALPAMWHSYCWAPVKKCTGVVLWQTVNNWPQTWRSLSRRRQEHNQYYWVYLGTPQYEITDSVNFKVNLKNNIRVI